MLKLGQVVATPNVLEQVSKVELTFCLARHKQGDWGILSDGDIKANELALQNGARILSSYESSTGIKFWIITEADRSVTTMLLPEDY